MIRRLAEAALDASVVLSFDRTGFRRHARRFCEEDDAARLDGRVALVTGANAGLGRATALELARRGADTWLLCRSREKGEEACDALRRASGSDRVFLEIADVSSLASVRALAERLAVERVDRLVHNAGVLLDERSETGEGLETTLATHVAGPFLLTRLLRPRFERSPDARVIFVASGGLYTQRLSCADPHWRRRPFDGVRAYAQAKRMQVALTAELARRETLPSLRYHAMHPGWADTPGVRTSLPGFHRLTRPLLRTPEEGADTAVWLCAAAEGGRESGGFWFDRRPVSPYLLPGTRETAADRRHLWRLCERLTARPGRAVRAGHPGPRGASSRAGSSARRDAAADARGE